MRYERKKACYIIRIFCTSYLIHQREETKGPIFNIAELLQHMAEHFSVTKHVSFFFQISFGDFGPFF